MTVSKKSMDNLKKGKNTQFSGDSAAKNPASKAGRNGQKKSAETKRRQKSLQEMTRLFLKQPLNDTGIAKLKRGGVDISGIDPVDMNAMMAVVAGQIIAAANGNSQAASIVRDWYDQDRIHAMENAEMEKLRSENEAVREKTRREREEAEQSSDLIQAWAEAVAEGEERGNGE